MLKKIISGGQTGADIAAIDAAIDKGFPYGGTLPLQRRCETGSVPLSYDKFEVCNSIYYPTRTELNVIDSDGTLIFCKGKPKGGTALTVRLVKEARRPYLVINIEELGPFNWTITKIHKFITENKIEVLNVAGPRESKTPGIHEAVFNIVSSYLSEMVNA